MFLHYVTTRISDFLYVAFETYPYAWKLRLDNVPSYSPNSHKETSAEWTGENKRVTKCLVCDGK
jgi:hypothetical protein